MAFFKFRKAGDDAVAATAQPESIEALRKRAKQRLIGAAVLVLAGVVGFPLIFDSQPRPIAVDIPIDIPDRSKPASASAATNAAVGAVVAAAPVATEPVAAPPAPAAAPVATPSAPAPTPAPVPAPAAAVAPPVAPAPAAIAPAASAAVAAPAAPASPPRSTADGERAKALLEGKAAPAPEGRFVVQVGAFAEAAKASAARQKLEKAGLKTYTQVAETKEGKRIRVRVGPFDTRAEADKAATRVKGLDLPATILTL